VRTFRIRKNFVKAGDFALLTVGVTAASARGRPGHGVRGVAIAPS